MSYLIGSGYSNRPGSEKADTFFALWLKNIHRYANPEPQRIVVVCVGGAIPTAITDDVDVIQLQGNAGHGHCLIGKETPKPHAYSGWTAGVMACAWCAYSNESDLIYVEQDALCFGPWVQSLYDSIQNSQIIFGSIMRSPPFMNSHQSVFMVRHAAIPLFCRSYLEAGDERSPMRLVEDHFQALKVQMNHRHLPEAFRDRMRPLPYDAPAWSAQQFSDSELEELRKRGLI